MSAGERALGAALVLAASAGFGTIPLFARLAFDAGVAPETATVARFGIAALGLSPGLRAAPLHPRPAALALATGLWLGFGVAMWFRALAALPVATGTMIFYLFPAFAVAIGWAVFGRAPSRVLLGGAALVLVGAALVVGPATLGQGQVVLVALALLAPAGYALLLNMLAGPLTVLPLLTRSATVTLGCALGALPAAILSGAVPPPTVAAVFAMLALGVVTMVLPGLALAAGAARLGPATGVVGSIELVVAVSMGWLFLGEAVRLRAVAGVAVMLAGAGLAALPPRR
ncbi:DMT family transporter [Elioraea sp.]|uniref:DMT family transporter n=1 Tax=Elioraea sp. TaxID=2185103 RepID=UPI003F6F81D7